MKSIRHREKEVCYRNCCSLHGTSGGRVVLRERTSRGYCVYPPSPVFYSLSAWTEWSRCPSGKWQNVPCFERIIPSSSDGECSSDAECPTATRLQQLWAKGHITSRATQPSCVIRYVQDERQKNKECVQETNDSFILTCANTIPFLALIHWWSEQYSFLQSEQ